MDVVLLNIGPADTAAITPVLTAGGFRIVPAGTAGPAIVICDLGRADATALLTRFSDASSYRLGLGRSTGSGRSPVDASLRTPVDPQELLARLGDAVRVLRHQPAERRGADRLEAERTAARNRALLDALAEAIVVFHRDGRVEAVNDRVYELIGLDREAFRRLNFFSADFDAIREDGTPAVPEDYAVVRALQTGVGADGEVIGLRRPDGRRIWVSSNVRPLLPRADGLPEAVIATFRDVTDRVIAERAIRESEERYRRLFDLAPDGVMVVGEDRLVAFVNQATARLLGVATPEELAGMPATSLIADPERPVAVARFEQIIAGRAPVQFREVMLRRRDGTLLPAEVAGAPMTIDGRPAALYVIRDLSARWESERALRESEERFRRLVDQSPDAIVVFDLTGRVRYANPAAARLTGADRIDGHLGRSMNDFLAPEYHPLQRTRIRQLLETGRPLPKVEMEIVRLDGVRVPVEVSTVLSTYDGAPAIQTSLRDLSERRRSAEERAAIARRLQEAQKLESLGVLAGGIAHDFNNLLTGILGNANLAQFAVADNEAVGQSLDQIVTAAERAAELCRQMLAYAGRGRLTVEPTGLTALVRDTVALVTPSIGNQVRLLLDLPDGPATVLGDPTQLRQIVMNLVINAAEAIGDRPGTIEVALRPIDLGPAPVHRGYGDGTLGPGPHLVLEVSDSGAGMSEETRLRVFEPFFSTKFTGRGLGLSAVVGIVRGHGGAIEVESTEGEGSVFRLFLPAAPGDAAAPDARPPRRTWRGEGRVLLVDDEDLVRSTVGHLLVALGFEVVPAESGTRALELLGERCDYRFVLLDLTMPEMSGAEVFAAIGARNIEVPVMVMSGFATEEVAGRFGARRPAGFLQKPFPLDALGAAVERLLSQPFP
ncbi:MAG: PAS domain S-box protein [Gemmatimonadales bacterium]